jgi:O-antigen biosynthesis protein
MKNQGDKHVAFIITGMHRSGTSLTSSLMESAGVNIGMRLMGAVPSNPKGHFENLDFVEFHERTLQLQDCSQEGWTLSQTISIPPQLRDEAKLIIEKNSGSDFWGWKDPRTTLFLDFWKDLLPQAYFVFTYRSPWEVVDSLYRRGDKIFVDNPIYALEVWIHYNKLILDFYYRFPDRSILLNIETLISDRNCIFELCKDKFGIEFKEPSENIVDKSLMSTLGLSSQKPLLVNKFYPEAIEVFNSLNDRADIKCQPAIFNNSESEESIGSLLFQNWANLSEANRDIKIKVKQIQQSQSQLQQAQSELELSQFQLQQAQSELELSQLKLLQTQNQIFAMKTSKFWKLRTIWFRLKPRLNLVSRILKIDVDNLDNNTLSKIIVSKAVFAKESSALEVFSSEKERLIKIYATYLQSFLDSKVKLKLATQNKPLISIILVLYNRSELTLQCLLSLNNNCKESYELIIVDNNSSDSTSELLKQLEGVRIISNTENLHFLLASNQAAREAKGEYILFLNNDTQVLPGSIASAVKTITDADDVGAVGGKIILLDGSLQEAGSIVWKDGSCLGYGRGDSPLNPMYMFKRDVDYCSGAFLLTKRNIFIENGGFDEDYKPAYYEETDYCLRLWRMNQRVVYDPNVIILHYEFASSRSIDSALSLQAKNKNILINKHKDKLLDHYSPDPVNILLARDVHNYRGRILFVDDRVPHSFLGSGFPRAREILHSFLELNYFVTFFPLSSYEESWKSVYQDIPNDTEIMIGYGPEKFEKFLRERKDYYDIVFISRPHNFKALKSIIEKKRELFPNLKFIYDAEALFSIRDIFKSKILENELLVDDASRMIAKELELASCADRIVSVSEQEGQKFSDYGYEQVFTLGHQVTLEPTKNSFENRSDILFLGAIHEDDSPNADSIYWFVNEILPLIQNSLSSDLKLNIVGCVTSRKILDLSCENVKMWGKVDDIKGLFNTSKIFIAPTRFAAGIPMKVHTSAGYGLPIVTTSLIASQLNWENGVDLLTADDRISFAKQCINLYTSPSLWQKLRSNSLKRVGDECSREVFTNNVKNLLEF